jgi:hypothetical protein
MGPIRSGFSVLLGLFAGNRSLPALVLAWIGACGIGLRLWSVPAGARGPILALGLAAALLVSVAIDRLRR